MNSPNIIPKSTANAKSPQSTLLWKLNIPYCRGDLTDRLSCKKTHDEPGCESWETAQDKNRLKRLSQPKVFEIP